MALGCIREMGTHKKVYDTLAVMDSIESILDALDAQTQEDTSRLIKMMQRISKQEPGAWNGRTLGFDTYQYKYKTGREGDNFVIGFYPRNGKITIYLMDGTTRYSELLSKLGKHTITGYCIYVKTLKDVDETILEKILTQSYKFIKAEATKGPIDRILWQTEK